MPIWGRKASVGTITPTIGAAVCFAQLELNASATETTFEGIGPVPTSKLDGSEIGIDTIMCRLTSLRRWPAMASLFAFMC